MEENVLTYEALMEFKKSLDERKPPRPIGLTPGEYDLMVTMGVNMDGYKRLELVVKRGGEIKNVLDR